jgi:hypothetical protein
MDIITKRCGHCKEVKPLSGFYKNQCRCKQCDAYKHSQYMKTDAGKKCKKEISRKYEQNNKLVCSERKRNYTKKHPDETKSYFLTKNYGITLGKYNLMLFTQNGLCAICRNLSKDKRKKYLCVDHDHQTGKNRGLLCSKCNIGVGQFNDSAENLRRAAEYLELHS